MTNESPFESKTQPNRPETTGEVSQEDQDRKDAEIMAGFRARREAEARAEEATKAEDQTKINSALEDINDSYDYSAPGSDR